MMPRSTPPSFRSTLYILLKAVRTRSEAKARWQREIQFKKTKREPFFAPEFGYFVVLLGAAMAQAFMAGALYLAIMSGERLDAEQSGKIVVSRGFIQELETYQASVSNGNPDEALLEDDIKREAQLMENGYGRDKVTESQLLRHEIVANNGANLIYTGDIEKGVQATSMSGFAAMMGSIFCLWWFVAMIFQGEGIEVDLQRSRHPMWEWIFSHPVRSGPVFLAEMLTPIVANPVYLTAPLFVGAVYGLTYNIGIGFLATVTIGIPVAIATACLGKALEIAIYLRCTPRSRGAFIGLMNWFGSISLTLVIGAISFLERLTTFIGLLLAPVAHFPWPWLDIFLGLRGDGTGSFVQGALFCDVTAGILIAAAVRFSVWGANQGLSGNFGQAAVVPARRSRGRFGRDPLYRKEFLWFIRDRSALIQVILVPVSLAAFELFNMRALLMEAQNAWNYLCGLAILLGTFFLWILGPSSLASEGNALWIALTWPRGMEDLLKAKARLWSIISVGMVSPILIYDCYLYPSESWKIVLVFTGWIFFSRTMALKSVTLVTVPSSSGEVQKIPIGRRWAASLGMLTFASGVLLQRWDLVIVGIVYSYVTAAAMWENFRARLPFLYDPWSEKVPPPPTLMNAMIGISVLVELSAVVTTIVLGAAGPKNAGLALGFGYSVCAAIVSLSMYKYLRDRRVKAGDVWFWKKDNLENRWYGDMARERSLGLGILTGITGGLVLGLFAHGYLSFLRLFPYTENLLVQANKSALERPDIVLGVAFMAIAVAPFAEEYLFRGLLYRALDREWGGWSALVGSAAFFAIYHPVMSWVPVFMLGLCNCLLFKNTGRLFPCVALHMVYNTVVFLVPG